MLRIDEEMIVCSVIASKDHFRNRKKMEISGQKESIYDTQYNIDFASHFFFFFSPPSTPHIRAHNKVRQPKRKQSNQQEAIHIDELVTSDISSNIDEKTSAERKAKRKTSIKNNGQHCWARGSDRSSKGVHLAARESAY